MYELVDFAQKNLFSSNLLLPRFIHFHNVRYSSEMAETEINVWPSGQKEG
jgi:hypothetical protein